MISKDRRLVVFSIVTSILSALLGFVQKFIESLDSIDIRIIFFSGILVLLVVIFLLFFLFRDLIGKIRERKKNSRKPRRKKRK